MSIKKVNNYFSHDFNARNDIKIKNLNMKLGMEGIGLYWCIIECLYENGGYLDIDQLDLLAFELRVDKNLIENLINNFDLFKTSKNKFYSKSVLQRLEKINEISNKNRENIRKRWAKKQETNEQQMNNNSNTTVLQTNYKKKENKIKENKINNNITTTTKNINIYEYIESNFNRTLSPIEFQKIESWLSLYKEEIIKHAINISVMNNKKIFSYADGILKNWKAKGFETLEQITEDEYNQEKKNYKVESKPEWFDKEIHVEKATEEEIKEMEDLLKEFK